MSKLNLYDLCGVLVSKNGLEDKEARRFVQAMFDIIQEGLDEDKIVKVKGLGTFKIIDVDARESINVNTGGRVLIEGHSKLTFTPDSVMKEIVNKPFSQFETVVLNDGVDFPETQEEEGAPEAEESLANPAVDKKPEPIVDKKPEPIVDKKPELVTVSETNTEVHAEVEADDASAVESSTSVEPDVKVEFSPPVDEDGSETEEEEERGENSYRWLLYCATILLLVVAAAYGGYLYGKYEMSEEIAHEQMLTDLKVAEETTQKAKWESVKDTTAQVVDATKIGAISTERIKHETKKEENVAEKTAAVEKDNEDVKKKQQETADDSKKYEDKDARVRTGAYRIVGLDKTVKAKAGQTVEDIAKRNLGPGMTCYVEEYNDLNEIKLGDKIIIPA